MPAPCPVICAFNGHVLENKAEGNLKSPWGCPRNRMKCDTDTTKPADVSDRMALSLSPALGLSLSPALHDERPQPVAPLLAIAFRSNYFRLRALESVNQMAGAVCALQAQPRGMRSTSTQLRQHDCSIRRVGGPALPSFKATTARVIFHA